jgi:beta-lactamase regulating signal transducer with metallopeptidase domain
MNPIPDAILSAILNTGWQAAAITLTVWALLRVTRVSAATRHVIWWALLAMLVLLPFAPSLVNGRRPLPVVRANGPGILEAPVAIQNFVPLPAAPAPRDSGPIRWNPGNLPSILLVFAAAGFLVQCARIGASYLHVRRIRKCSRPASADYRERLAAWIASCRVSRPVELLISDRVVSPMAVGFLRPAIILPEGVLGEFQNAELDHVLLHELAHLVRRDDWTNLAARIAGGLLAWHPVAIWVLRRIPREQEIACDDWVVAMTGAPGPYAACLARLFDLCLARRRVLLASGMADRGSQLGDRIEGLLRRRREFAPSASLVRVAGAVVLLAMLMVAAARAPRWIAFAQDVAPAPPSPPKPLRLPPPPAKTGPPRTAAKVPVPPPVAAPEPPPPPPADPPRGFLAAVVASGYGNLSVDDIVALKTSGVSAEYLMGVSQSGWGKLTARQIIDLKNQGVPADYLRAAHEAGIAGLSIADISDLRSHGVRLEEVRQVHALGFGPFNKRQLIDLWTQGVRAGLFQSLKDAGFVKAEPAEIIEARQAGMQARDFNEARQYGPGLTLRQVIKLKRAGVLQ